MNALGIALSMVVLGLGLIAYADFLRRDERASQARWAHINHCRVTSYAGWKPEPVFQCDGGRVLILSDMPRAE